jgi:hypothetical protein
MVKIMIGIELIKVKSNLMMGSIIYVLQSYQLSHILLTH